MNNRFDVIIKMKFQQFDKYLLFKFGIKSKQNKINLKQFIYFHANNKHKTIGKIIK